MGERREKERSWKRGRAIRRERNREIEREKFGGKRGIDGERNREGAKELERERENVNSFYV